MQIIVVFCYRVANKYFQILLICYDGFGFPSDCLCELMTLTWAAFNPAASHELSVIA